MKKDLCAIFALYETDVNSAREQFYSIFKLIFLDCLKKKRLWLDNQEIFTQEDLIWECFLAVDYIISNIVANWYQKPIFKKKVIIWYRDWTYIKCPELKWYVYLTIARTVQDKATEKNWFRVPFNRSGIASKITYHWWYEWMSIATIDTRVTYEIDEDVPVDILPTLEESDIRDWLEQEFLMAMIYNHIDKLEYLDKKIFVKRYVNKMSIENIANDIWVSKRKMTIMIRNLWQKIKALVDEKDSIWTTT